MTGATRRLADLPHDTEKAQVLAALVPAANHRTLQRLAQAGVRISVGATDDRAFDNPAGIRDVYLRLHDAGHMFARARGHTTRWAERAAMAVCTLPLGSGIRRRASAETRKHRIAAEALRAELLYDQPDVQAMPWHRQNGRALALGTIVDAHDLSAAGSPGLFPRVSGRLTSELLEAPFGPNTGWLEGLSLAEAVAEAAVRFRGWERTRAEQFATTELADVAEFTTSVPRPGFKDIVSYCTDSLGIRSRKEEVTQEIRRHSATSDRDDLLLLSIGCGTAAPMLETLATLRAEGRRGTLVLVDQDPGALAAAQQLAGRLGLRDAVEVHCERLILGRGRRARVLDLDTVLHGRQVDVCEDSGLREYFPDFLYRDLAGKAWSAVRPGGLLTTGNMNVSRPQPEFLHGLMGWPIPVRMRTAARVHALHVATGLPQECLRLRLTQDAVYTMLFAIKPDTG